MVLGLVGRRQVDARERASGVARDGPRKPRAPPTSAGATGRPTASSSSSPPARSLLDTPGMRELGVVESLEGLTDAFADIEDLALQMQVQRLRARDGAGLRDPRGARRGRARHRSAGRASSSSSGSRRSSTARTIQAAGRRAPQVEGNGRGGDGGDTSFKGRTDSAAAPKTPPPPQPHADEARLREHHHRRDGRDGKRRSAARRAAAGVDRDRAERGCRRRSRR